MSVRFPRKLVKIIAVVATAFLAFTTIDNAPESFSKAKVTLKEKVYYDQNKNGALGTIYCGCDWRWVGKSGGRVDHKSCGYQVRAQHTRAERTEWEHVVPASWFGQQRQCWKNGGRANCSQNDPVFSRMEANLHNLTVAIGEVNADRSNYRFGELPKARQQHGQCTSKVDFNQRVFEARDEAKGMVARINFYMADRYDLKVSPQQQKLLMYWNQKFPVTAWELERNRRITKIMGHSNEFVTGQRRWTHGHQNSKDGLKDPVNLEWLRDLLMSILPDDLKHATGLQ